MFFINEVINGGDYQASNLRGQQVYDVGARVRNQQRDLDQLAFAVYWCRAYDASLGFFLVSEIQQVLFMNRLCDVVAREDRERDARQDDGERSNHHREISDRLYLLGIGYGVGETDCG